MHVTLVKTPTLYSYRNTNYLRHLQHTEALHQSNVYEKLVQYTKPKPLLVKFSAYIIWSETMISGHSASRIEAPYNYRWPSIPNHYVHNILC